MAQDVELVSNKEKTELSVEENLGELLLKVNNLTLRMNKLLAQSE